MTPAEVDAIVSRACTRKRRYGSRGHAIAVAAAVSLATGEPIRSYRCRFSNGTRSDRHWRLGHVPSMDTVEALAEAIRARAQAAA